VPVRPTLEQLERREVWSTTPFLVNGVAPLQPGDVLSGLTIHAPAVTEGISTGAFTLATFTDSNANAPLSDFTATVSWGDGGTDILTSKTGNFVSEGNGVYALLEVHTYAEQSSSPLPLSVQIGDAGGSSVSGSVTLTVADAPLSNPSFVNLRATEGLSTGRLGVATFHDANFRAPLSDFTATISWGDGSSTTLSGTTGGVFPLGFGNFALLSGHTYAEEGTYTVSVQVLDVGGSSTAGSGTEVVGDAPLSALGLSNPLPTEGIGLATYTVATFHDNNLGAPVSDFTATVSWGDGGTTAVSGSGGGIVALGKGNYAVVGGHTYAEEGPVTMSVQVSDVGGPSASRSRGIRVADAPLPLPKLDLLRTATEGVGTTTVATFTDLNTAAPASDFTATIAWGDGGTTTVSGSGGGIVSLGGGSFAVLAGHTYADEGTYTLVVQLRDAGGSSVATNRRIAVGDAPLSNLSITAVPTEGVGASPFTVATFSDANTAAPATDFTATVTWGDGSASGAASVVALGGGAFAVLAAHTYTEERTATLAVQVRDVGGASLSGSHTVAVADAPLGSLTIANPGATEGLGTGAVTVATFSDANTAAPVNDFTAIIAWGDNSTTTVTGGGIQSLGGGVFAVLAGHTYEEGTFTLSVQVQDVGGASVTGSRLVRVADAPLSSLTIANPGATEGISTGTFTVATFTDANTAAPLSDFTAVIAWGDGSTSTVTSANGIGGSGGSFAVLSSHTFGAAGTYTLSVQVLDVGGSSVSGQSSSFTVASATGLPFLVKDINPGAAGSHPEYLTNVNGTLFFSATDGGHGWELWKSDGTSGTVMVKDIYPGPTGSDPRKLTNVNGTLFFSALDSTGDYDLWKSDGTSAGTVLVNDIRPGRAGNFPYSLTNVSGTLFFAANDGSHGYELWKSDGSSAGTVMVNDIFPGSDGSGPFNLTNVGGTLFFGATDGSHGNDLWKSDGTSSGTVLVNDIFPGDSTPRQLTNVSGTLFFNANDGSHGYELWKSDGTSSGTTLVKDIFPRANTSFPYDLTNVNGTLFFRAGEGSHGTELWRSDGSSAGTALVNDIRPGSANSNPFGLTSVSGTLFFSANDGSHGYELWKSDGTSSGTVMVSDIYPGSAGSVPFGLTNVNGTLFFRANDGSHGFELWQSDGTSSGTARVMDIFPGSAGSYPSNLTNVSGTLFFQAQDGSHGYELWALLPSSPAAAPSPAVPVRLRGGSAPFTVPAVPQMPPPAPARGGGAAVPTAGAGIQLLGVSNVYHPSNQVEAVRLPVNGPNGASLPSGQVTVRDGGQSQTVPVSGGLATAAFTLPLSAAQPGAHAFVVNGTASDPLFTAAATGPDYYFQLLVDLLLWEASSGLAG
jgi:ELWxxDGT repeat protein